VLGLFAQAEVVGPLRQTAAEFGVTVAILFGVFVLLALLVWHVVKVATPKQIETMRLDHKEQTAAVLASHQVAVATLVADHKDDIQSLLSFHAARAAEFTSTVATITKTFETTQARMEAHYEAALLRMEAHYEGWIKRMEAAHQRANDEVFRRLDALASGRRPDAAARGDTQG
jgi:Na+-transporting methylmalonyl-CoA/oxaloacetate decarboxylase gamma subunit